MLSLQDILAAQRNLSGLVARTPLEYSFLLSQRAGCEVYLKLENWQKTGSFKVRGAINKVASLTEEEKARGLVTASAGNHALGVAYAARALGNVPTTVFVPVNAPTSKLKRLEEFECDVLLSGNSYDEAHHFADDFERAHGATYVHAYDDPLTIAGQGTVGLEVLEDLPEAEAILVPVGGGGLIAGIAVAAKAINPHIQVIGVQPGASPAAYLSLRDGRPYEEYDAAPTIADGLAGGFGCLPFEIAGHLIDEIVLVSEEETRAAVFTLLELAQLVVEGAGAVGIAALLAGKVNLAGRKVVAVLTGANIDASLLFEIMRERLR
ncbi:MAG: pyridoxal-phosphate dependent enzyme [Anaerolineae bacterium]|nr:pyridoxal-phosphate dependent enzyme [Anaerolineae bacterium]